MVNLFTFVVLAHASMSFVRAETLQEIPDDAPPALLRRLASTIYPVACSGADLPIKFQHRLDITYVYRVDFKAEDGPDLPGIEEAVAKQLAAVLNICDNKRRPRLAIFYSGYGHKVSQKIRCYPASIHDKCQSIDGVTSILIDDGMLEIASWAFEVISRTIENVNVLNKFTSAPLTSTRLLGGLGENVVPLNHSYDEHIGDAEKPSDQNHWLIAALVAVVVLLLLIICLMVNSVLLTTRQTDQSEDKSCGTKTRTSRKWNQLEEVRSQCQSQEAAASESSLPLQVQSSTWSVSDITSLTNSHESTKGSSTAMDRIDEEDVPTDESEQDRTDAEASKAIGASNKNDSAAKEQENSEDATSTERLPSREASLSFTDRHRFLKRTGEPRLACLEPLRVDDAEAMREKPQQSSSNQTEIFDAMGASPQHNNNVEKSGESSNYELYDVETANPTTSCKLDLDSTISIDSETSDALAIVDDRTISQDSNFVLPSESIMITPIHDIATSASLAVPFAPNTSNSSFSVAAATVSEDLSLEDCSVITTYSHESLGSISGIRSFWAPSPTKLFRGYGEQDCFHYQDMEHEVILDLTQEGSCSMDYNSELIRKRGTSSNRVKFLCIDQGSGLGASEVSATSAFVVSKSRESPSNRDEESFSERSMDI